VQRHVAVGHALQAPHRVAREEPVEEDDALVAAARATSAAWRSANRRALLDLITSATSPRSRGNARRKASTTATAFLRSAG
jgi:hypothetical protein